VVPDHLFWYLQRIDFEKQVKVMAYLALYREWRPKYFKDIVGQEHVTVTLINALKQGKVAHAYLFSGPRGTGKTTTAKILGKALNCSNREGAEPCNECPSCREIDQGIAMDVLEIDAASNRGIEDIRNLRENIKLAPSGGKYKVYIIDEVHMLSNEAFNALLKTLEEPPANVVFVLATTEAHKVPLTILSRVQRFEFHRIAVDSIIARLKEVCADLNREVDPKALQVIAVKAEGGLRDALSILDQCLLREGPIGIEHVYQIIGMVGEEFSADLVDAFLQVDYGKAIAKLGEGVALGRDPRQIIKELLDYLRQLLLYLAAGQEPLVAPNTKEKLIAQAQKAGLNKVLAWINALLKGEGELRFASNARLAAELVLVQALYEQSSAIQTEAGVQGIIQAKTSPKTQNLFETRAPAQPKTEVQTKTKTEKQAENIAVLTHSGEEKKEEKQQEIMAVLAAKWPEILAKVKKEKKSTHAFLLEGKPAGVRDNTLFLVFGDKFSFHRDKFTQPENKNVLEKVLEQVLGIKLNLCSMLEKEYNSLEQNRLKAEPSAQREEQAEFTDETDPVFCVQKAVEFFGPELVQVKND